MLMCPWGYCLTDLQRVIVRIPKCPLSSCVLLCFLFMSAGLKGAGLLPRPALTGPYLFPLRGR